MGFINTTIPTVSTLPQAIRSTTPKPAGQSTTSTTSRPKKMEGMAVQRYRKTKQKVQFFTLKEKLFGPLSKGDQFLKDRFASRLVKARKIAAPELIQQLLKRKASRGKGKKRGSDLSHLMTNQIAGRK